MTYDLIFWKELRQMGAPVSTYDRLLECADTGLPSTPDIDRLPIAEILNALKIVFPGIYQSNKTTWDWSSDFRLYPQEYPEILAQYGGFPESPWPEDACGFNCYFSDYHLSFALGSDMHQVMKAIVDVMVTFDCPVYDPQTDRRARAAKNLPATIDMLKEFESRRSSSENEKPSQSADFEALSLTFEDKPVIVAPTLEQLVCAVDQLTPYGGPGYLIVDGYEQDYVQVAGGNGMYTVEWRITLADNNFHHWIAGYRGEPSEALVAIPTNGCCVRVQENEELSAVDVKVLLAAYASQKGRPVQYSWRDARDLFGP